MKLSESEKRKLDQRIQMNMDIQENQLFRSQESRRLSIAQEKRRTIMFGVALVLLFIVSILFTNDVLFGNFGISRVVEQLTQRVNDIVDLCLGNPLSTGIHFFMTQFAAPVVVGMALASAGACYQGLFHNPMASPTMLGVTSGGMLGGTIYMVFFSNLSLIALSTSSYGDMSVAFADMSILDRYIQQFFVMGGCFIVIILVMILAKISGRGKINTVALMLGGTVFTTTISSILELTAYILMLTGYSYTLSTSIRGMLAGQFGSITSPKTLLVMSIPILIPLMILLLMSNKLNVIAFGEEEAASMGVNVGRDRLIMIILVMIMAKISGKGKINTVALMLGGTVFTTTISSILSLIAYILMLTGYSYTLSTSIRGMLAGQFGSITSPKTLLVMSIPILIPLMILLLMSNKLNVIAFGEEEAASMGVNVGRDRLIMIILTTIMTGTTVAFCGQISFVGLMIPQFARFFVGTDYKYLLPTSAFLGGIVMLLAFDLYYTLNFSFSVGTYVNVVGSIAFLIFMIRYRRKGHADWT